MRDLIREYRGDREPDEMRKAEIERELERIGHPDVHGLVEAVKRRRETARMGRKSPGKDTRV